MNITSPSLTRLRRRLRLAALSVPAFVGLTLTIQAKPVPENLGNGLDKIVNSQRAISEARTKGQRLSGLVTVNGKSYTDEATAILADRAISEANNSGRYLVRVTLDGRASYADTIAAMKTAAGSLTVTAEDQAYRGVGVVNAYVSTDDVPALAQVRGVSAVILELKPRHNGMTARPNKAPADTSAVVGEVLTKLGTAFDQGVTQHRVDQINKYYNPSATLDYQGVGMKVACLSDSFNALNGQTTGVNNYNLPGSATNPVNTTPVYVLEDFSGGEDEGRGMCEIVYKMAPKAALGFATADTGEVGFANNIRLLGGLTVNGVTGTFGADTICDDVGYFDEPFFQDGIIGNGVDDVAAAGVAYFSSAANDIGINGYDSDLRWVANGTGLTAAAGNTALTGTNINLTNVPAALYAGGFHNFNPNGQDVAQTVNITSNASQPPTVLQWNEPYDQTSVPQGLQQIYSTTGTYTTTDLTFTVPVSLTAGTLYDLEEMATNNSGFDGIVTVRDPNGNIVIGPQDNSVDESVRFIAPVTGTGYTITIGHFSTTTGSFSVTLSSSTGYAGNTVQTRISLLAFDTNGTYVPSSSLTVNPLTTNQPLQLGTTLRATTGTTSQLQYVIARANVPTGPNVATHVRYLIPGNGLGGIGPAEYFAYTTVTTGGHAMANGCNGCAAYNAFKPNYPETFSSPGPVMVYYDKQNNRLATPEVRLQPRLGFLDNGNTSFFGGDVSQDPDTNQNFSGTSAAGPHGAAIAALVLQAKGGRRSVTPTQMTSLLERSTFPHDLDPNFASGVARTSTGGKVTVSISSDGSANTGTGTNDNNAFAVSYVGAGSVTSLVFNPGGTAATGGNSTGGNNGVTYSATGAATVGGTVTYFENSLPGACFLPSTKAFAIGNASTVTTGVTATPSNLSGGTNQYYTLTLAIAAGNLSGGNTLRFGIGRGVARSATTGSAYVTVTPATTGSSYPVADIFGGGVSLPNGVVGTGMTFSGTTSDGGTFSGVINNRIGAGYSPLDGFGFVNAQAAVQAAVQ